MARNRLEDRFVRKLIKQRESYLISLPVEDVRYLGWQKSQKLTVTFDSARKAFIVRDWKK